MKKDTVHDRKCNLKKNHLAKQTENRTMQFYLCLDPHLSFYSFHCSTLIMWLHPPPPLWNGTRFNHIIVRSFLVICIISLCDHTQGGLTTSARSQWVSLTRDRGKLKIPSKSTQQGPCSFFFSDKYSITFYWHLVSMPKF